MEPILQRFGDVTIQRLEKPKDIKLNQQIDRNDSLEDNEGESSATINLKRSYPDSQISIKKFKLDSSSETVKKLNTDNLSENFSETEFSEYDDSDSEMDESEFELNKSEIKDNFEDESTSTNNPFFEKLTADETFTSQDFNKSSNSNQPDSDDYDFDIKEKLKEMGEISFETVKKGDKPKKIEISTENEVVVTPARKPGGTNEEESTGERKGLNLRRNIREVMDETKLDESTLAAQRQEAERLQRVQEQQRLLRELQKQAAQERMQHKVLSLLQGNNSNFSKPSTSALTTRIGNTVLVKLPNGQTKPMTRLQKKPFDFVKVQKNQSATTTCLNLPNSLVRNVKNCLPTQMAASVRQKQSGNLTPSVSIAPVAKKIQMPTISKQSDSESETEDVKPVIKKEITVPTIDISSDEDCIVVSEPECDDGDDEDDPSNSGMHTNDEFNQPDENGRVVVNIGHPDNETDLYLAPQLARVIKPHQIGGVRFLYDNVIESIGRYEKSAGFGCILAHSMGLGKTLQIVCFSDIFLRHTSAKTILCIMPINTLQNWMAEYNMWLPTEEHILNNNDDIRARNFNLHVLNDSHKTLQARAKVIHEWKTDGGVLLIGYEQFRLLSLKKYPKSRRKTHLVEPIDDDKNKALFEDVHEALIKPGPDLVICDEGHRIKNSHASISQALKQIKTKRRIVLTGYPLQNNLMEYWCMVDFVRPNYLGSKTEFCNMFERPIMNGQCIDSTENDIKLMRYRAHVLHSLLVGFVQRRSHSVLQTALPQKEEYVLLVRMLEFQRKLYETFMDEVVRSQAVPNPLKAFAVCCKIWNHPDVLYNFLKKRARGDAIDIDLEEVSTSTGTSNESNNKVKKLPARRRTPAKGKNVVKPAASITPYNSGSDSTTTTATTTNQMTSQGLNNFQQNFNYFEQSMNYPNRNNFSTNINNENVKIENFSQDSNFINNISDNSQFPSTNLNQFNFNQQQNYQQQQQNFFDNNYQQNDFFNNQQFNFPNNSNSNQSWIKKENYEIKPKINIISDIKIPSDKKINIIRDVKLEPKLEDDKFDVKKIKDEIKEEDEQIKMENRLAKLKDLKEDTGIPYDWAIELLKDYLPGCIENSAKMEILFCIITESIALGDRLLVFSQSLITLDLIEQFLHMNQVPGDTQNWCKNLNYYRLDGSTSALEREKLINEFNSNAKIHLFLVSTRAGSLGINLIGANRVVVLDASWNPCHDTQAVCRVYRYGQKKPCFVYRLVVDNCLEKKIYDRQINKQGMSDRVVDECNPDAHLTMKDVSTLCWDEKTDEGEEKDWSHVKHNYNDIVLQKVIEKHGKRLNKQPFKHESLLVDRKEKQLSQQEKRLAKKSYEREKQAASKQSSSSSYNLLNSNRNNYQRPIASVRPMQQGNDNLTRQPRWIPAEHWQRQGMTAQEMTLPLDVVIPTNQPEKGNIVLKAGQKVLVLKSPKGVYMQLESGKIVAIKTAIKVKGKAEDNNDPTKLIKQNVSATTVKINQQSLLQQQQQQQQQQQKRIVKPFAPGVARMNVKSIKQSIIPNLVRRGQNFIKSKEQGKNSIKLPINVNVKEHNEILPSSSSDEEHINNSIINNDKQNNLMNQRDEIEKRISLLKKQVSVKRLNQKPENQQLTTSSVLERLEQTTSSVINDNTTFQESLDNITSSYKDDNLEEELPIDHLNVNQASSDVSDQSDDVAYVSERPPVHIQHAPFMQQEIKSEPQNDYYNNYYNYNMQPYHTSQPPPPQNYVYPTQPPPNYDIMGYGQPQQAPPQYTYGYQTYPPHPPPPPPLPQQHYTHPPQPSYDYNTSSHPPIYNAYNSYPQQYAPIPTPPPPQGMYPPPATQPPPMSSNSNYSDYQYNTASSSVPFYPNS